jgi:hypothetical protein
MSCPVSRTSDPVEIVPIFDLLSSKVFSLELLFPPSSRTHGTTFAHHRISAEPERAVSSWQRSDARSARSQQENQTSPQPVSENRQPNARSVLPGRHCMLGRERVRAATPKRTTETALPATFRSLPRRFASTRSHQNSFGPSPSESWRGPCVRQSICGHLGGRV